MLFLVQIFIFWSSSMSQMRTNPFSDAVWTNRSLRVWRQACYRPLLPSLAPCGRIPPSLDKEKPHWFPLRMPKSSLPQSPSTLAHKTSSGIFFLPVLPHTASPPPICHFSFSSHNLFTSSSTSLLHSSSPGWELVNLWLPQHRALCKE